MAVSRRSFRIGINALYLLPGQVGGTEIYVRELIAALAAVDETNEYFVYRNRETGLDLVPAQANFIDCPLPINATSRPARIVYEQSLFIRVLREKRNDVLLNTGFTAPLLATLPMATIFYDLQYKHHPEFFTRADLIAWSILLPLSGRRSKRIIAMSHDTQTDLHEQYPWSKGKVAIVPHGVDESLVRVGAVREREQPREPLLLCVSAIRENKNLENLLRAFARFHASRPHYRLVIVGPHAPLLKKLESLRDELGLHENVTFTGWISREKLMEYFARARALVFPSHFEGFGIPILEGLTARLPVACSDIAPTREIAGNAAAYFEPLDVDSMARAIESVTHDEAVRERNIELGAKRAVGYSWPANAAALVALLTEIGAGKN
jgi:glycosyltransferase involved in cell wall biosynthesis